MKPIRLPWRGKDVPSAIIDVVRGCNCVCKACFNRRPPSVKPLEEIRTELSGLRRLRNVATVGISGGEPLLHPQIAEIVRLVHDEGLSPSLLTNGILWDESAARELASAGLEFVMLHVQPGQKRPDLPQDATADDAFSIIKSKCAIANASGIEGVAVATVNVRRRAEVESILEAFLRCEGCQYLWLTLERDMRTFDEGCERASAGNGVQEMSALVAEHGWRPFAGIGGVRNSRKWRWMTYHGFERVGADGRATGFAVVPPSLLERAVFAVFRMFRIQLPYRVRAGKWGTLARIALNALSGGPLRNLAFVFAAIFRRERVRPKHLVVEALPEFSEDGKVEHCDPCVDATVYGDRLVPACLVDTEFAKRGCE